MELWGTDIWKDSNNEAQCSSREDLFKKKFLIDIEGIINIWARQIWVDSKTTCQGLRPRWNLEAFRNGKTNNTSQSGFPIALGIQYSILCLRSLYRAVTLFHGIASRIIFYILYYGTYCFSLTTIPIKL